MTEFITPNLVGFIALALFMWKITRDISGVEKRLTEKIDGVTNRLSALGERVALTIKITRELSGIERRLSDKIDAAERILNGRLANLYSTLPKKS